MQPSFIGFATRMRILTLTLLLSSSLAFFPNMRITKSPTDMQGARSKIALNEQQDDNLLREQVKEFQDGWKNLFSAGPTTVVEEVVKAPSPSKKPEEENAVPSPVAVNVEPTKTIASAVEEKKEIDVVKPVEDKVVAHQSEPAIERPKLEQVAEETKPEPVVVKVEAPKLEMKEEVKEEEKVEPKVEEKVEPVAVKVEAKATVEEEVKEARVAPSAKPKPAAKPAPVTKPIPAVPVMFTMNEVALKAEPSLINERNEDDSVGMALRDIPMKSAEEMTKVDDTKDVLKAQQAVARSFLSLLSSPEDIDSTAAVEVKPQVVEKKVVAQEVVKPPAPKAEVTPAAAKAESAPVAAKKEEASSNLLEGFLGFLKNDPALEQQRQQQAAKQQQAQPKPQPVAVKQEVKPVAAPLPSPATPPKVIAQQQVAPPVPAPVKVPAPMPVVSTAKKPEPPVLDKLFGFLKSDPAFEYAQQQKAKEKANNRPSQPPAVSRALFSPSPPAPPAEPREPVFQKEKLERPEVKVATKKADESPKISIPFLNSNDKKKDDATVVVKKAVPEVFERPVVAARSSSSTAPVKRAKIIISTTEAQPQATAAPAPKVIPEVKKEVKKVEETKPAISLPSFGFFGNKVASPPAAPAPVAEKKVPAVVVPKPAPAPVVVAVKKEEPSKPQGGGGLFGFLGNNNQEKSKPAAPKVAAVAPSKPAPAMVSKPAVVTTAKVAPAAPAPAVTAAPMASKPAAGGGLFGFLNPSPVPSTPAKVAPAAVSKPVPVVVPAKVEAKKPVVAPAAFVVPEPVKKAQALSAPGGGLFGMFGGNNKAASEKKVEDKQVVVVPAKVAPKAATVVPKAAVPAPAVVVAPKKKAEPASSNSGGGLFGFFGGAKKADSSSNVKPEPVVAATKPVVVAKPAPIQQSKAAPAVAKVVAPSTTTVASSLSSSSKSSSGGLFGGFLGGGSKPAASTPATTKATPAAAEKVTSMNPTFQKLVSKTLKNDSGKLATFQRSTDTLRAGTLDASRYVSAMDTLFGGPETLGSILPPLIAELPEKDVAKILQVAYDRYIKTIKPSSAAAVKTVGAVIKAPEKVQIAKRGLVEGKMKAVAAGQLSVKDFVDYLNKDIGATRTKSFAADVAAMLPKEKGAEFTKLVSQLK